MRKQTILRKLFLSAGFLLLSSPLFAVLGAAVNPEALYAFFPALLMLTAMPLLVRALPEKLRVAGLVPGAAAICAATYAGVYLSGSSPWLMLLCIPLIIAFLAMQLIMGMRSGEEFLAAIWYVGLLVLLICRGLASSPYMSAALPFIQAVTPVYLVYVVFALNAQAVQEGMGDEYRPSRLMLLRNRLLSAGICAVMLLLAYQKQLQDGLRTFCHLLKRFLLWLYHLLLALLSSESVSDTAARGGMGLGSAEGGEPARWLQLLEKLLQIGARILAVALALMFLWHLARLLARAVRALMRFLRSYAGRVSESYEDTVESLLDWGEVKRAVAQRAKKLSRRDKRISWEKLSPRQRVRQAYQLLRRRNKAIPDSRTAREALTHDFSAIGREDAARMAEIYDAARYSEQEISVEAAQYMQSMAEKKG